MCLDVRQHLLPSYGKLRDGPIHMYMPAEQDPYVGQVLFVPDTHYVFTLGKDHEVKFWDADRWELLLTLQGHHAEVGTMLCVAICLWERAPITLQCMHACCQA